MKKNSHKILFVMASMVLLFLFQFPLWKISLGIPQYPKNITLHIWINKMVNATPKAREIINVLNHNIGMKPIETDAIPELKYFQWIVAGAVFTGIIAGLSGNKKIKIIWLAGLVVLCVLGLFDFYLWQYHYGHDLEPDAPIVISGSSFQPPLIGVKTIVNFTVSSWPMPGVIFPFISMGLGWISIWMENKR